MVDKSGAKRWAFIFQWQQKRTEMGLGNLASVSLKDARERAGEARGIRSAGRNPVEVRKEEVAARQAAAMTFGEYAETFTASVTKSLKNDKHKQQWRMTLSVERDDDGNFKDSGYCLSLRPKKLGEITTEDVLGVLSPIWDTVPETAARLQNRIERLLDGAKVQGYRTGDNSPASAGGSHEALRLQEVRRPAPRWDHAQGAPPSLVSCLSLKGKAPLAFSPPRLGERTQLGCPRSCQRRADSPAVQGLR